MWILYALMDGKREAHFFNLKNKSYTTDKEDIHWVFTLQRFMVFVLIAYVHYESSLLSTGLFIAGLALIFSFFHNGFYYVTRHKLDSLIYKEGWKSNSNSSTAIIELGWKERFIFFIIGISSIITSLTIQYT